MNSMNKELLKEAIQQSGITITALASKMGISREGLYNKINGQTEFTVSEINGVCDALRLDSSSRDAIFFSNFSELNSQTI